MARTHFNLAEQHFSAKRFAQAARHYLRAYEARPHPDLLFNVAQTYRNMGDDERAAQLFRRYLRKQPNSRHRRAIQRYIKSLAAKSAPIRKRRSGLHSSRKDSGDPLSALELAVSQEPPTGPVTARTPLAAADRSDANPAGEVAAGADPARPAPPSPASVSGLDARASPSPSSDHLVQVTDRPRSERRRARLVLYSGLGLSAGCLLAGAVTGGLALSAHSQYSDLARSAQEREELRSRGRALSVSTNALLSVAGALAAASLVVYLTLPSGEKLGEASVSLWAPGGPGLVLGQRF